MQHAKNSLFRLERITGLLKFAVDSQEQESITEAREEARQIRIALTDIITLDTELQTQVEELITNFNLYFQQAAQLSRKLSHPLGANEKVPLESMNDEFSAMKHRLQVVQQNMERLHIFKFIRTISKFTINISNPFYYCC